MNKKQVLKIKVIKENFKNGNTVEIVGDPDLYEPSLIVFKMKGVILSFNVKKNSLVLKCSDETLHYTISNIDSIIGL